MATKLAEDLREGDILPSHDGPFTILSVETIPGFIKVQAREPLHGGTDTLILPRGEQVEVG